MIILIKEIRDLQINLYRKTQVKQCHSSYDLAENR